MKSTQIFSSENADNPSFCCDDTGRITLIWKNASANSPRDSQSFMLSSQEKNGDFGPPRDFYASSNPLDDPRLLCDSKNEAHLFFMELENDTWSLRTGRVTGESLPESKILSGNAGILSYAVALGGDGVLWVVWQESNNGTYRLMARTSRNGEWTESFQVSPSGMGSWRPVLTSAAKGGVWLAWELETIDKRNPYQSWRPSLSQSAIEKGVSRFNSSKRSINICCRHLKNQNDLSQIHTVTNSPLINVDCDIAETKDGNLSVAWTQLPHWLDSSVYRLNLERQLHIRFIDSETGKVSLPFNSEDCFGGRIPVSFGKWGGNVAKPRIGIDQNGGIQFFFRRIDFSGDRSIYNSCSDWGWNLWRVILTEKGWNAPEKLSDGDDFSDTPYELITKPESSYIVSRNCLHPAPARGMNSIPHISITEFASEDVEDGSELSFSNWGVPEFDHETSEPRQKNRTKNEKGETLLWGDLHRHSELSKCAAGVDGSLWDHLRWAKNVAELDFYCLTDHVDHMNDYEWEKYLAWIRRFEDKGSFIPIIGFEGGGNGKGAYHLNAYAWDHDSALALRKLYLANLENCDNLRSSLLDAGLIGKVWLIPHFHGKTIDVNNLPELLNLCRDFSPFIEVVQTRGFAFETAKIFADLDFPIAFTGSSDHASPPWSRPLPGSWCFQHALTGLWVKEFSTCGIREALLNRRSFATNGVKMMLDIEVEGKEMGSDISISSPPKIKVKAQASTAIYALELFRDGKLIKKECFKPIEKYELEFQDEDLPHGRHHYFAKAFQLNEPGSAYHGEAWTSPVWVKAVQ